MLKDHQTRPTQSAQRSMRRVLLAVCSLCLLGLLFLVGGSTGVARAAPSAQLASYTSLQPRCVTLARVQCSPTPDDGSGSTTPDPGPAFAGCYGSNDSAVQACADLWSTLLRWYPWLAVAAAAIGCVWIFASAFQATGKTGEGDFSSWKLVLDRVKIAGLVFFVLWRLSALTNDLENIWYAHAANQGLTNGSTDVVSSPPTTLLIQLSGTLIIILIQVFLLWLVLRLLTTSLWGIASIAGDGGGRPLGPIMFEIIELLGLGALIIFLPSVLAWLLSLLTF